MERSRYFSFSSRYFISQLRGRCGLPGRLEWRFFKEAGDADIEAFCCESGFASGGQPGVLGHESGADEGKRVGGMRVGDGLLYCFPSLVPTVKLGSYIFKHHSV